MLPFAKKMSYHYQFKSVAEEDAFLKKHGNKTRIKYTKSASVSDLKKAIPKKMLKYWEQNGVDTRSKAPFVNYLIDMNVYDNLDELENEKKSGRAKKSESGRGRGRGGKRSGDSHSRSRSRDRGDSNDEDEEDEDENDESGDDRKNKKRLSSKSKRESTSPSTSSSIGGFTPRDMQMFQMMSQQNSQPQQQQQQEQKHEEKAMEKDEQKYGTPARKRSRQELEIDEDHDDEAFGPPMKKLRTQTQSLVPDLTYSEFVDELNRYIYEKSAQDLDRLLSNNQQWLVHEMPGQQLSTALCDGTINNKIELNEAPVETLKILKKNGFDLTADELEPFRCLLYSKSWKDKNDHITMASYDMIEYVLSVEEDLSIQSFDCRQLHDNSAGICSIDSVQGVDAMVSLAFVGINEIRQERKIKLEKYLYDVCAVVQPSNSIIAEFIFGSYVFHYDDNDYDPQTEKYTRLE